MKESPIENRLASALSALEPVLGWTLHRQVRVGRYVIDFLVETPACQLIVEADGEQWHRDRWAADMLRDRYFLLSFGIPTIRFSGAEILRNGEACSSDVVRVAAALGKRQTPIPTPHVLRRHAPNDETRAFVERMAKGDE